MSFPVHLILLGLILALNIPVLSQQIQNIRTRAEGNQIIIQYDVRNTSPGSWLDVKVYSSHNSFSTPLNHVTGAVGKVAAGEDLKIEWEYGQELDHFSGDLSFEIQAEIILPFAFINPKKHFRRGRNYQISWTGGRPQDSLVFLFKGPEQQILHQASQLNKEKIFTLKIDRYLALGNGYTLQLISTNERILQTVNVRRKVKRIWIYSAPIACAAAVMYLISPKKTDLLPAAPGAPKGN